MPDHQLALNKYRRIAATYDKRGRLGRLRRRIVAHLDLKAGDVVLDVACGTGLNFPLVQEAIGRAGRLIGIDLSPDMLAGAGERVSSHGWTNVTLINSPAEEAQIPEQADVILFSFTHDVMRSPRALENVMRYVKPKGRVAVIGWKWAPWWAVPANIPLWFVVRRYVTTLEGFAKPWTHLVRFVPDLQVARAMLSAVYIAWGTKAESPTAT